MGHFNLLLNDSKMKINQIQNERLKQSFFLIVRRHLGPKSGILFFWPYKRANQNCELNRCNFFTGLSQPIKKKCAFEEQIPFSLEFGGMLNKLKLS